MSKKGKLTGANSRLTISRLFFNNLKEKYATFVGKILRRTKIAYTSNKQELL